MHPSSKGRLKVAEKDPSNAPGRNHPQLMVFFSCFVGVTSISSRMTAAALMAVLTNHCNPNLHLLLRGASHNALAYSQTIKRLKSYFKVGIY